MIPGPARLAALLAVVGVAALAPGPARAEGPPAECDRPLSQNDLEVLDKVADGRLYLSELDPGAVDCLVERLLRTKDASTRSALRAFIQNDVWEAVRDRLRELEREGAAPPELRRRVKDLRATDYSDAKLFVGGLVHYKLERQRTLTTGGGATERYVVDTQSVRTSASGSGVFETGAWKIEPSLSAFGDALWTAESLGTDAAPAERDGRAYVGAGGDAGLSVLRRDERANLSAYGFLSRYRDPPPDRTARSHGAGGAAKLREIGGSALGLEAAADWYVDDRAPLGADYFDPAYAELTIHGEAAYMWPAAGLLASYDHLRYDDGATVYRSRYAADAGALVLHLRAGGESYVRLAAGGGTWSEGYQLLGDDRADSAGGELHGRLSGDLRVARALRLDFAITAQANASRGTFEGWYPSGKAQVGATLELDDFHLRAAATVGGERRDLNIDQQSGYVSASADASFAPTDFLNLIASGAWQRVRQEGLDAYDDRYWRAGGSVGARLSRRLDVWLWTEGKLTDERFDAEGLAQILASAQILERLSFEY